MRINSVLSSIAAAGLALAPVAASAAPAANPAASLSVVKSVRGSAATSKDSNLFGGGILAAIIVAGIAAIGVIAIVNDGDDSDSN